MTKKNARRSLLLPASKRRKHINVYALRLGELGADLALRSKAQQKWVHEAGFAGDVGELLALPEDDGSVAEYLFGLGSGETDPFVFGKLSHELPGGVYNLVGNIAQPDLAVLAWMLGGYRFRRYTRDDGKQARLVCPEDVDVEEMRRIADAVCMTRDLINMPANDMGPDELEEAVRIVSRRHKARTRTIVGDRLLKEKLPLIHAVGRASDQAPRLIDMKWGSAKFPKVTLVGKGVCFDTGGLDLKSSSAMLLMKKDMGGAANVLGLADMIMGANLNVRLRVLIPAVENAVSGNAFRPGDVLPSRKGLSVEIGNTDAEGRLVLADALALADEEKPDILIDMATLTGAARVALGPDLPPFYTDDEDLAAALAQHAVETRDPLWRMPLWKPYDELLASKIADVNHISSGPFAGSLVAALFLARFAERAKCHLHFDIYAWNPKPRDGRPEGGEAQGIRALYAYLKDRYGG